MSDKQSNFGCTTGYNSTIPFFMTVIADIDNNLEINISRLFADDTKVRPKMKTQEDTELLQQDLITIYNWVYENLVQFNENKFERMSHGDAKNVERGVYKTKSGKLIEENKTVKDLEVLTSRDVWFLEHIDDLVLLSKIKAVLLLKTFKTREAEPILKIFNSFINSRFGSCCLI